MFRMELLTDSTELVSAHVSDQIKESGVKLTWLCEKTGIPRSTMVRRLNGSTSFSLNELDRIAAALRVTTADLLRVVAA